MTLLGIHENEDGDRARSGAVSMSGNRNYLQSLGSVVIERNAPSRLVCELYVALGG